MDRPSIDLEEIKRIAEQNGIDLNSGLNRENADLLNYAFLNNSSFPDGTMVRFEWNDKTNTCDVSVMCTTSLSTEKYTENFTQDGVSYELWKDLYQSQLVDGYDEGCRIYGKDGDAYTFSFTEKHTFSLNGVDENGNASSLNEAFETLNDQIQDERWKYLDIQDNLPDDVQVSSFREEFIKLYGREPTPEDYLGESAMTGSVTKNTLYLDDIGTTYDDGYVLPSQVNDVRKNRICRQLQDQISQELGYSDPSLSVQVDDKTGKIIVSSNYLSGGYMELSLDGEDVSNIVASGFSQFNDTISSDKERYAGINLLKYMADNTDASGDSEFHLEVDEQGNLVLRYSGNSIVVDEADLMNPANSSKIKSLLEAQNLEVKLNNAKIEGEVTLLSDGTYLCTTNTGVRYFQKDANGQFIEVDQYRNPIGKEGSSIESFYNASNEKRYNYNTKIARNKNGAISVVDREKYNSIIKNLGEFDYDFLSKLNSIASTLSAYGDTSAITSAGTEMTKIKNDLGLLGTLIDSIVNLFLQCDSDMKKMLDGLLTGSDNSFIDRMFALRGELNGAEINMADYQSRFVETYSEFLGDMKENVDIMKVFAKQGLALDLTIDEYNALPLDLQDIIKLDVTVDENGNEKMLYYIKGEDYDKYFKEELDCMRENGGIISLSDENVINKIFDSSTRDLFQNKELFNKLFAVPMVQYTSTMLNYQEVNEVIEGYNRLSDFEPYTEYLFDPGYREVLNEVFEKGTVEFWKDWNFLGVLDTKKIESLDGANMYMSPAELAMEAFLCRTNSGNDKGYIDSITRELNQRQGLDMAVQRVKEIIDGKITWDDYLREFGFGLCDGFMELPWGVEHLWNHNTSPQEWSQYYAREMIEECYNLEDVYASYKAGDLSDDQYELLKRLTGSESVKDSYAISDLEKAGLGFSYDVGDMTGNMTFNAGLDILTALIPGAYVGMAVKAGIKGLSSAGYALNASLENDLEHDVNYWAGLDAFIRTASLNFAKDFGMDKISGGIEDAPGVNVSGEAESRGFTIFGHELSLQNKGFPIFQEGVEKRGLNALIGIAAGTADSTLEALYNASQNDGSWYNFDTQTTEEYYNEDVVVQWSNVLSGIGYVFGDDADIEALLEGDVNVQNVLLAMISAYGAWGGDAS